jgi:ribosomal protein S18 acetylase RimI-like enzyme
MQTVWRLTDFAAVAMWIPPEAQPDGDAILAALSESVPPEKHRDAFAVLEQMEAAHPKDPHWYLPWLGVDGAQQGAGLGSELLKQCLAYVDAGRVRPPSVRVVSGVACDLMSDLPRVRAPRARVVCRP